jgi:putative heme iron utilization protein
LLGEARQLLSSERGRARETYLARHPRAQYWVDFDDFSFWRLDVKDLYFVGGFAAMDWVTADAYRAARPDPLADAGPGILDHMNRDHVDALIAYAHHFAGEAADEATMIAVDRLGFRLRLRSGERLHAVRIAFPREVRTAADSRTVLIEMLGQASAPRS